MQKTIPYDDILVVTEQARSDGKQVADNHRALNVFLEIKDIEGYAKIRATDAWMKIQRAIPALHYAWTGHKPQFLNTYIAGFLGGYSQGHSRAFQTFTFPEVISTPPRSSKQLRRHFKKMQKAA